MKKLKIETLEDHEKAIIKKAESSFDNFNELSYIETSDCLGFCLNELSIKKTGHPIDDRILNDVLKNCFEMSDFIFFNKTKKVLDINENLFFHLFNSNFNNIHTDFLKLPYECFFIKFPNNNVSINYGLVTKKVEGVFVTKSVRVEKGVSSDCILFRVIFENNDDIFPINIFIKNDPNLKLEEEFNNTFLRIIDKATMETHDERTENIKKCVKVAINTILYYTYNQENCEKMVDTEYIQMVKRMQRCKSSGKKKEFKRKLKKLSSADIETIIPKTRNKFKIKLEKGESSVFCDEYRKRMRLHLVSGHFRKQVCGEGRKDRKLIFIEPFWKGQDSIENEQSQVINVY